MFKFVPFPFALVFDGTRSAIPVSLPLVALCAVLGAGPALADQDYPPGLFENSPVVRPGQQYAVPPSGPQDATPPSASPDLGASEAPGPSMPPGPSVPPGPSMPAGPMGAFVPPPPVAMAPPDDYCASVAFRTFGSIEELRRAHALCDHYRGAPPPPPGSYFGQ